MNDEARSPGSVRDELGLVRDLLAAAPPASPDVAAAARASLMATVMSAAAADRAANGQVPSSTRSLAGARRQSRLPVGPRARLVLASAALAAAAALAVVMLVPGTGGNSAGGTAGRGTDPGRTSPGHSGISGLAAGQPAHAFLLSMASRVLSEPAGRYWCTNETDGSLQFVGPADTLLTPPWSSSLRIPGTSAPPGFQYSIVTTSRQDRCLGLDGTRFAWGFSQDLGAAPASKADAAKWRKDGSPTRWKAWYANQYVSAGRGPVVHLPAGGKGPISERWGSYAALPASPARLRSVLLSVIPRPGNRAMRLLERLTGRTYAQMAAGQLMNDAIAIMQAPVRPAVRAAAYQVLAGIPGMRMRAGLRGPDGRTGTALWLDVPAVKEGMRRAVTGPADDRPIGPVFGLGSDAGLAVVIVDPATGYLLASETVTTRELDGLAPGTRLLYSVYSYRWTSKLPAG